MFMRILLGADDVELVGCVEIYIYLYLYMYLYMYMRTFLGVDDA